MPDYSYIKDKIKKEVDLLEFISSIIPVNSQNKAICPFHEGDTDPSLSIKGDFWHCFGCGRGGDIFNFVMNYYSLDFKSAVEFLAKKYGYKIEEDTDTPYFRLMLKLWKNFSQFSSRVEDILKSRKISKEIGDLYKLGYLTIFNPNSYDLEELKKLNLVNYPFDNPQLGVKFIVSNSLTIPVIYNNIIYGFIFKPDNGKPKYRSMSNNSYFQKSKFLYGYDEALPYIKQSKSVIFVEGFFDVYRMRMKGYLNTVAILGSSLSTYQIRLIKPYVKEVFIMTDGDIPGRKSAIQLSLKLYSEGIRNTIFSLPDNEDPDSYFLDPKGDLKTFTSPLEFFNHYFSIGELTFFLKNLREVTNLEFFNKMIQSISAYYPKIPDNLILSSIFSNSHKDLRSLPEQPDPSMLKEIVKSLIIGIVSMNEIPVVLLKLLQENFKDVFKVYYKYNYFKLEEIDKKFLEPIQVSKDSILKYIDFIGYLKSDDPIKLLRYKRRFYGD